MKTQAVWALLLVGAVSAGGREPGAPAVGAVSSAVLGEGRLTTLAYSPDGRLLATGGGRLTLRAAGSGAVLRHLDSAGCPVRRLTFSPDGDVLSAACTASGEFRFWRVSSGAQLAASQRSSALAWNLAFLPGTQSYAAAFSTPELVAGPTLSGEVRRVLVGHRGPVNAVAAGRGVLASAGQDGAVRLYALPALTTSRVLRPVGLDNPVRLAVNAAGTALAVGDVRGTVDLYWLNDLARVARLPAGSGQPPPELTFSPDGQTLAAVSGGVLHLLDTTTGAVKQRLGVGNVDDLAYAPDGQSLALAGPSSLLRTLDAVTLAQTLHDDSAQRIESEQGRLAVTRGGLLLAGTPGGRLLSWDLRAAQPEVVRGVPVPGSGADRVPMPAATRGTLALVTGARRAGGLELWRYDLSSGAFGPLLGLVNTSQAAAFSPDGQTVALGRGRTVQLRGTLDGQLRSSLTVRGAGGVQAVQFFPDGQRVALVVSQYEVPTLEVWNLKPRQLLGSAALRQGLNDLAVSPDGRRLVTVGNDGLARLWDAHLRPLGSVRAHGTATRPDSANTVAFSPDGQRFATGGHDYRVRVWRAADLAALGELRGHSCFVLDLAWFAPRQLASGSCDGTRRVWTLR